MLSIIGLASPSSQTRVSRSTTAGFATEVTATPELSEESWTASSPSPSPCFGIKPSTTLRSERTLTRAQRRFPLDQEWGVHPPGPEGRGNLVGTESRAGRERHRGLGKRRRPLLDADGSMTGLLIPRIARHSDSKKLEKELAREPGKIMLRILEVPKARGRAPSGKRRARCRGPQ